MERIGFVCSLAQQKQRRKSIATSKAFILRFERNSFASQPSTTPLHIDPEKLSFNERMIESEISFHSEANKNDQKLFFYVKWKIFLVNKERKGWKEAVIT